jgi:aquaporin Z
MVGTFWLVLGGCGSAVLAAAFPGLGIGFAGVALAAQVAGALLAGGVLYAIAAGAPGFSPAAGFAANGYGAHSPGGYALPSAAVCELVLACGFMLVIMGVTDKQRAPAGFGPLAIGLALTLVHLISIPVTNTSVNPARSTGVAPAAGRCATSFST